MEQLTRDDFKQLYYIDQEIERYKLKIEEHETRGTHCTQNYQYLDMPKGSGVSSKVEDASGDAVDVQRIIDDILVKRKREEAKLTKLIDTVPDAEMRLILSYRYVDGLSWRDVGKKMNTSEDAVKAKDRRFFLKI